MRSSAINVGRINSRGCGKLRGTAGQFSCFRISHISPELLDILSLGIFPLDVVMVFLHQAAVQVGQGMRLGETSVEAAAEVRAAGRQTA